MPRAVVELDLGAGLARLGAVTVDVAARPGGALAFDGLLIRPLAFGERWRVLAGAPAEGIGPAILAAASGRTGGGQLAQVLALYLSGARPGRAIPAFAEQVQRLVAGGWTPTDVMAADADLVDLLTEPPADAATGGGRWTSIVLLPEVDVLDDEAAAGSVAEVVELLQRDLAARAGTAAEIREPSSVTIGARAAGTAIGPASRGGASTLPQLPPTPGPAVAGAPAATATVPLAAAPADRLPARDRDPLSPSALALPGAYAGKPDAARRGDTFHADAPGRPWTGARPADPHPTPGRRAAVRAETLGWIPGSAGPHPAALTGGDTASALLPYPLPIRGHTREPASQTSSASRSWVSPAAASTGVVSMMAAAPRVAPSGAPDASGQDDADVATSLAALLDAEADLRGLLP